MAFWFLELPHYANKIQQQFPAKEIRKHKILQESIAHSKELSKFTESMLEKVKVSDLLDKDFKATILNLLRGKGKYRHTNVGSCAKDIGTKRKY